MNRTVTLCALGLSSLLVPTLAIAHISISSGVGTANTTQKIAFGVGHGCQGADTSSVRVEIPSGVTSVRAVPNVFGKVTVEKDTAGATKAVTWTKAPADLASEDSQYAELVIRAKLPDAPFTKVFFPAKQTCQAADGGTIVVDWVATVESPDGGGPEPAPAVVVLPARKAGWNKYTVPTAITDLPTYFGDAAIVWKGNAAYSANPATVDQIKATEGASVLTELAANDEIWVRY